MTKTENRIIETESLTDTKQAKIEGQYILTIEATIARELEQEKSANAWQALKTKWA